MHRRRIDDKMGRFLLAKQMRIFLLPMRRMQISIRASERNRTRIKPQHLFHRQERAPRVLINLLKRITERRAGKIPNHEIKVDLFAMKRQELVNDSKAFDEPPTSTFPRIDNFDTESVKIFDVARHNF